MNLRERVRATLVGVHGQTDFMEERILHALQEVRRETLMECIKEAEDYDSYGYEQCHAPGHDHRFCAHCEGKNDGAEIIADLIRSKLKEENHGIVPRPH